MGGNYTDEQGAALVDKFLKSGLTLNGYMRKHGICRNTILRQLRKHNKQQIEHKQARCQANRVGQIVLVIPDLHCPFQHPDALDFLIAVKRKFNPSAVVCLGDEIDAHAFSRYPKDPDGMSPGQELKAAIENLTPFYLEFPEVLVCESNHTVRPFKQAYEAGLPASFLPAISKLLNAPDGWQWASRHMVDDVLYIHGDNGKSGAYAHVNYMKQRKGSVVIGHIHSSAGVNYEGEHFAMNAGCLINPPAYCFKYAKNMLTPVNLGCGIVFNGRAAHFLPLHTDSTGRWIGRL